MLLSVRSPVDDRRFRAIYSAIKLFRLVNQEPSTVEITLDNQEELVANSQAEISKLAHRLATIDQSLADLAGNDTPAIWSSKIADLLQSLTVSSISFHELSDLLGMEDVEVSLLVFR